MIFEVPEARGMKPGRFFRPGDEDAGGDIDVRLINVSLSRARAHVIVIGDLAWLADQAQEGSAFARLMGTVRRKADRVPSIELVRRGFFDAASPGHAGVSVLDPAGWQERMARDIGRARGSIRITSPRLGIAGVKAFAEPLAGAAWRGVGVSVVTDRADERGATAEQVADHRRRMEAAGVRIVETGRVVKERWIAIDRQVVWLSSAGPLPR